MVVFDNIVQYVAIYSYDMFPSLLNGEQADASPVYETKYIAVTVYESLLNGEQAEAKYNTITRLYIVIIYSRSVVFISTLSSMKPELFLKKGGVILSV